MQNPKCPRCGKRMQSRGRTPGGKQRWRCETGRVHCYSTTNIVPEEQRSKRSQKTPVFKRSIGGVTTLVIPAAQNATPAHKPFIKAIEQLCGERSGDILAIPLRYKNPTSRWSASQANDDIWAPEITPYLCNERKRINRNLVVLGDVKVQPTATSPLNGFEAMTHGESAILGHPKIQSKTVAAPQSRMPKILSTTGVATLRNYTDSRAGKQGEFHHTIGALLVEVKGKKFQIRRINADKKDGSFIDLDRQYTEHGTSAAPPALGIVHGDTHVDFADPKVVRAQDELATFLKVQTRVFHDLRDGYAENPHHIGNPFNAIAKIKANRGSVEAEQQRAFEFLEARMRNNPDARIVVVPSNHDDFMTRWIIGKDWRADPANAEFYLRSALEMVKGTKFTTKGTEYPSPFAFWGRQRFGDKVLFLDRDESFVIGEIECGMHSDKGPNGARGSLKNLRRIGVKWIGGHHHAPGEDEGGMQVGTTTHLRLEYNVGPSGWLNTDGLIYANGKRTLINYIDGEFRL